MNSCAGEAQLWRSCRSASPSKTHFTSSHECNQQPPLLGGLAPIYVYVHIRIKGVPCLCLSLRGLLAAASAVLLVLIYLQPSPSTDIH
jgi:hypothetical protein